VRRSVEGTAARNGLGRGTPAPTVSTRPGGRSQALLAAIESLPIRTIAGRWGVPAAGLHHAYALARQEFKATLLEVVAFHHPGSPAEVEQEAAGLLKALS
jgi:hypothetical protein